jgi:nucleoside-diphosphate-sugar epimerase
VAKSAERGYPGGMTRTLLSFGHGYSARALAARLLPEGWRIIGTTRSPEKAAEIAATGVEPLLWPGGPLEPALRDATHILVSAGPDADGDPVLRAAGEAIAAHAKHIDWAGYLSTTGVYGDHGGDWVDEDTPLHPATERGRRRVSAETAWRALAQDTGLPLHIFRLAGIYGPGRGPFEKVRNGTARRIVKPGQVFSRTHVDDIAQVLAASIARPNPVRAYNVCDDDPAPPQDVIAHAAELLGLPLPPEVPFEEADLGPMAASFYAESKKVRNDRIKDELGVKLLYPTYREGLLAVMAAEGL